MPRLPEWSQPPKSLDRVSGGNGEANYMLPIEVVLELEGLRFSGPESIGNAVRS